VSPKELFEFLRRELAPTPGRGLATLRITLACLITVALVLMFRIPNSLLAFVLIYLITQEDTAATVIGSVLGWVTLTDGFTTVLLVLELSLDIPWLRICFFAGYFTDPPSGRCRARSPPPRRPGGRSRSGPPP